MLNKKVQDRHSETAMVAALYRNVAHREFGDQPLGPDNLALHFLPPHLRFLTGFGFIRRKILTKTDQVTPGMYQFMLARTAFFDGLFKQALEEGVSQIVLLGAGYDTRALRFIGQNSSQRVFELDIATTQNRKRKILAKAGLDIPASVSMSPIDFNRESLDQVLTGAGFDLSRSSLFLWEGVSYYLAAEAMAATLEFVAGCPNPETRIAFDYAWKIPNEEMKDHFGVETLLQTWEKHRQAEPFKTLIELDGLESYLEQRSLKLLQSLNAEEMEQNYLNGNGRFLGRVNAMFGFAVASPQTR